MTYQPSVRQLIAEVERLKAQRDEVLAILDRFDVDAAPEIRRALGVTQ